MQDGEYFEFFEAIHHHNQDGTLLFLFTKDLVQPVLLSSEEFRKFSYFVDIEVEI